MSRPDHGTVNAARPGLCGRLYGANLARCSRSLLHEGDCAGDLLAVVGPVEGTYVPPRARIGLALLQEQAEKLRSDRRALLADAARSLRHLISLAANSYDFAGKPHADPVHGDHWIIREARPVLARIDALLADPLSPHPEPAGSASPAGAFLRGTRVTR